MSRPSRSVTVTIVPCGEIICPEDYRRDTASFNVVASVYVEAEWDPD